MSSRNIKQEAQRLVEHLPEDATWDDLMDQIYGRQAIDAGLADSAAGRTLDVQEVRAQFGLLKCEGTGRTRPASLSWPSTSVSPGLRLSRRSAWWRG